MHHGAWASRPRGLACHLVGAAVPLTQHEHPYLSTGAAVPAVLGPGERQRKPPAPLNASPMAVNSIPSGPPHARPVWAPGTCGEPNETKKNTHPKIVTPLLYDQDAGGLLSGNWSGDYADGPVLSRSIPPPWGSIRFHLALRTYAPWGCIVRVLSQTRSRKNTHPKNITALHRAQAPPPRNGTARPPSSASTCRGPFNSTPNGGQFGSVWLPARVPHAACVWFLAARRNQEKYPPKKYYRSCVWAGIPPRGSPSSGVRVQGRSIPTQWGSIRAYV